MDDEARRILRGITESVAELSRLLADESRRRDADHREVIDTFHAGKRELRAEFEAWRDEVSRIFARDRTASPLRLERSEVSEHDGLTVDLRGGWKWSWGSVIKYVLPWVIAISAFAEHAARWLGLTPGGKQ